MSIGPRPPAGLGSGTGAPSSRKHFSQANRSVEMASLLSLSKEIALNNLLANQKIPGAIIATKDGAVVAQTFFPPEFNEDTEFQIASLTKSFTAVGVLTLVAADKLSLNMKLNKINDHKGVPFLTDFPHADEISLRQLLNMTSGLPGNIKPRGDFTDGSIEISRDELWQQIIDQVEEYINAQVREDELSYEPGTQMKYSNINYMLLTYIIEKISNQSYGTFMEENIFTPLGMTLTGVNFKTENRAPGQTIEEGACVPANRSHESITLGAGCLKSTASDMAKWGQTLNQLCRGQCKSLNIPTDIGLKMFRAPEGVMTSEGVPSSYGFGFDNPTTQTFAHGGNFPGAAVELVCKQGECIIVLLSNQDITPPVKIEALARPIIFGK